MSDFEGLFALFTVMYGLIVAEISLKFADAVDLYGDRPIGVLTPALAFLLLLEVTGYWLFVWTARHVLTVSWHIVFGGVLLSVLYFMAAALLFPRQRREWRHLDDHYWSRKKFVAGAMLVVSLAVSAAMLTIAMPDWNDWWFYFYFGGTVAPLAGLVVSRSRRLDLIFLAWAIAVELCAGSDVTPNSQWGTKIGLNFAARSQPMPAATK